jgi:hypothetical protein
MAVSRRGSKPACQWATIEMNDRSPAESNTLSSITAKMISIPNQ